MPEQRPDQNDEPLQAALHAVVGGAVGYGAVAATGMSAAGMVGAGAGIGAAAGPVGIVAGVLIGLSIYGLRKAFEKK